MATREPIDVPGESCTLAELLAPIHAESRRLGTTEEEVDRLVDGVREELAAERKRSQQ